MKEKECVEHIFLQLKISRSRMRKKKLLDKIQSKFDDIRKFNEILKLGNLGFPDQKK